MSDHGRENRAAGRSARRLRSAEVVDARRRRNDSDGSFTADALPVRNMCLSHEFGSVYIERFSHLFHNGSQA